MRNDGKSGMRNNGQTDSKAVRRDMQASSRTRSELTSLNHRPMTKYTMISTNSMTSPALTEKFENSVPARTPRNTKSRQHLSRSQTSASRQAEVPWLTRVPALPELAPTPAPKTAREATAPDQRSPKLARRQENGECSANLRAW
jgi:hypothetical protein